MAEAWLSRLALLARTCTVCACGQHVLHQGGEHSRRPLDSLCGWIPRQGSQHDAAGPEQHSPGLLWVVCVLHRKLQCQATGHTGGGFQLGQVVLYEVAIARSSLGVGGCPLCNRSQADSVVIRWVHWAPLGDQGQAPGKALLLHERLEQQHEGQPLADELGAGLLQCPLLLWQPEPARDLTQAFAHSSDLVLLSPGELHQGLNCPTRQMGLELTLAGSTCSLASMGLIQLPSLGPGGIQGKSHGRLEHHAPLTVQ
mmetsp:Transcript_32963/g.94735  ORF Transcript_32963/g.94735 Transcript_32963/m.94735 type:complete len:255 (+) Transcript_32963:1915-2679(+)